MSGSRQGDGDRDRDDPREQDQSDVAQDVLCIHAVSLRRPAAGRPATTWRVRAGHVQGRGPTPGHVPDGGGRSEDRRIGSPDVRDERLAWTCPGVRPLGRRRTRRGFRSSRCNARELEQPHGVALRVDVDRVRGGLLAEARHRHHVAAQRDDPAGAGVRTQVAHRHREPGGRVAQRRVVREREVGLRHADREGAEARGLELPCLLLRRGRSSTPSAPYTFVAMRRIFSSIGASAG